MDDRKDTAFSAQLNTEIEKLKGNDYTSYQNFYNETSQYLYGVIWNMVQDQNTADTLIQELYTNIYASIASELTDNSQFYMWAENKARMLATTYLTTHGAAGARTDEEDSADGAVAAAAANAGLDAAVGAGQTGAGVTATGVGEVGIGSAAATAGQAGMGTAAAGAGQAGVGTATGLSGTGSASGAGVASGIAHAGLSLGAKIAIGIASVAVVVGGGVGLYHALSDKKKPADTEQTTEIVEEVTTEQVVATESDAVAFTEEITDSNPVLDGYCLERIIDDADQGGLDGYISYFRFIGDSTPELKQSFETWQNERVNEYYNYLNAPSDWALSNGFTRVSLNMECHRADNRILTVTNRYFRAVEEEYDYGVLLSSINCDVQTGKILTLDDIGDVKGDIKNALLNFAQEMSGYELWTEEQFDQFIADNTLVWGMDYDYFFVLLQGFSETHVIKIPYSDLPGLKPEYLPEGNVYFEEIGRVNEYNDDSVQYDIDGDGIAESVGIYETVTGGNSVVYITKYIGIDGVAITEEFSTEFYSVLYSTGGKTYIILRIPAGESGSEYRIYDVSSGSAVEVQRFTDMSEIAIGPYPIARKTRIDVLGTYNGYKIYNLGPEGLTTEYNYYVFEDAEDVILTAKAEIPCKFEKDGMLVEGTIPAGTVIHPVECDTDNKIFVFRMEDGTRGRFYYGQDENGITINGVPEMELFENLPYTE